MRRRGEMGIERKPARCVGTAPGLENGADRTLTSERIGDIGVQDPRPGRDRMKLDGGLKGLRTIAALEECADMEVIAVRQDVLVARKIAVAIEIHHSSGMRDVQQAQLVGLTRVSSATTAPKLAE